ncbi:MFS transporter [Actinomyces faecalis]|uniref:MFS transporter n=1 Tax=Actinomyces faecalis TaxID=2722820 RepID=UPI001552B87B|nr:MFS transporter [Actinomyces faecalis]
MTDAASEPAHASPPLGGVRAWLVLAPAAVIYVLAVAARTSFAVAVPQASERFPGGASMLATFVVLQLAVYALAQVPVGLLLDRFGSRRVLVTGGLVVACGQLLMATATSVPAAVAARVLVGAGDATAFISTLRLLPTWFPLGTVPLMSQLVSVFGQLGQVVSAVPFLALLHARGWTTTFATMSGISMAVAMTGLALIRDVPPGTQAGAQVGRRERTGTTMAVVMRHPGTWLGFFCHWIGMFPAAVLTLMWGVSWMTQGLGVSASTASAALTANTAAGVVGGMSAGILSSRLPAHRSTVVIVSALVSVGAWIAGLLLPQAVLAAFLAAVVLGVTAPYSGIGFDVARSLNAPSRWGTCTGLVNTGGFTATILAVELVGVVLDLTGGNRSAEDFRLAVATTAAVWLVGMAGLLVSRRATRRHLRSGRWQTSF